MSCFGSGSFKAPCGDSWLTVGSGYRDANYRTGSLPLFPCAGVQDDLFTGYCHVTFILTTLRSVCCLHLPQHCSTFSPYTWRISMQFKGVQFIYCLTSFSNFSVCRSTWRIWMGIDADYCITYIGRYWSCRYGYPSSLQKVYIFFIHFIFFYLSMVSIRFIVFRRNPCLY